MVCDSFFLGIPKKVARVDDQNVVTKLGRLTSRDPKTLKNHCQLAQLAESRRSDDDFRVFRGIDIRIQ